MILDDRRTDFIFLTNFELILMYLENRKNILSLPVCGFAWVETKAWDGRRRLNVCEEPEKSPLENFRV